MNRRKRDLQIATEDVMENSDGVLSLRRDKETEVMQSVPGRIARNNCRVLGFCSYNRLALWRSGIHNRGADSHSS